MNNYNLIKRICRIEKNNRTFFSEFHHCFGEIETLNKTHHIEVQDNVKQVVTKLEKELKRMVDLDILKLIKKHNDWVNSLVIIEQPNGKLCICQDFRPLTTPYNTFTL